MGGETYSSVEELNGYIYIYILYTKRRIQSAFYMYTHKGAVCVHEQSHL